MHTLKSLAVFTLVLNVPTCYTFFDVKCVPEADKGALREIWKLHSDLTSLQTLKKFISQGVLPRTIQIRTGNHFTMSNDLGVEGRRDRAYFLCHLTGEYEFYFSCVTSCEWSIKEAEQSSAEIVGGAAPQPMDKMEYKSISANLTEAHAYFIELLHFTNDSNGRYTLRIKGPDDDAHHQMTQAQLVAYKKDGKYSTLHPGEWEAWSPCSVPCGPLEGRQVRNRSCATYPSLFNMTDGYKLTMSRACNVEQSPCERDCKTQVDLGFVIDGSGSIEKYGKGNFKRCLEFVKNVTRAFVISASDTRVGAIVFSSLSEIIFNFQQYTTQAQIETAIDDIKYPNQGTLTGQALTMAKDQLFNDTRPGVPRVLVVLTDGISYDDVVKPSEELRNTWVIIFAVGLGKKYDEDQLTSMATVENVVTVDFHGMMTIVSALQEKLCKAAAQAVAEGNFPDQPPTIITANASASTSIRVSWHPVPLGRENEVVTGYRVLYIDIAETQPKLNLTVEANISFVEVTGLLVYTNYCIQVLAFTSKEDGTTSDCFFTRSGEGVPSASPTNVTVQNMSSTSLTATWSPVPAGYENGVITGFKVLYVDAAESQAKLNFSVPSTNFSLELTNLLPYTNYCIQVLAFTQAGDGVLSDCVVASTEEDVPSEVPTNPSASMDLNSVRLSWDQAPADGMNGELIAYAVLIQGFNTTRYVAKCQSSLELKNVNFTADTCIQIAAVTRAGYGNLTDCIRIDLLDTDFTPRTATSTIALSSSTIKVTLTQPNKKIMGGQLLGYYIKYQAVRQGGEPIPDTQIQPAKTRLICANYSEIVLTDLPPYVMYKIEVAPLTDRGQGNFSVPVYGETCRCKEYLSASLVPSFLDTSTTFNSLANVLSELVTSTCGRCDEHNDSTTKLTLVGGNQSVENAVTFPVTLTQAYGNTDYGKFIPVITVPGLVIVKRKAKDNSGLLTKVTANSVFDSWPVFVITLVTALLAGIIIWILDSRANKQHFPRTFFKGAGEGFWWSFISMSTVGYGDRCPQSIPAKMFAMAGFLVGLIIFCIFMGSVSSVLTVTVAKMGSSGSYGMVDDGKVAVVANSSEYKMAVKKFRNKVTIGSTFPNLTLMVQALKDGNISSVLLDMYVPLKRKDLFNGSWFDVTDLLEGEMYHGVLLQGEGVRLAKQMKSLIIANNIQTKFLQGDGDTKNSETEEESVVFLEPSSPYYLNTMIISAGLLLTAIICGLFYQAFCYKRLIRDADNEDPCTCGEMKRNITKSVETFYQNFSNTYQRMRERHKAQLITLMKQAKRASK